MTTELDKLNLRDVFGRFTTGVTVVSTATDDGPHAMTLNAFVPLSLDPPLIAVSIANRARMCPLIAASGHYSVSVLSDGQKNASLHFAGVPTDEHGASFIHVGAIPMIEGAMACVGADVVASHPAGDHTLYIGAVNHLESTEDEPLVFFRGKYRDLSSKYEPTQYLDAWSMFDVVP